MKSNLKEPKLAQSYTILYQNNDGIRKTAGRISDQIFDFVENYPSSPEVKPKLIRILTKEAVTLANEQLKAELYYNSERMLKK